MTPSIFDEASMVATVLRVRDVAASVGWYREKLGLEAIHIGADGPEHPFASFSIAGSIVSLWQLPPGDAHAVDADDTSTYVVVVTDSDLEPVRRTLAAKDVKVSGNTLASPTATGQRVICTAVLPASGAFRREPAGRAAIGTSAVRQMPKLVRWKVRCQRRAGQRCQ
jgi:hypothetical protein